MCSKYQELASQREVLEERLEKAEGAKSSVDNRIYQKVSEEYQSELKKLGTELAPLEADVEEARRVFPEELKQIEAMTAKLREKVDEFEFRHRVGEYGEAEMSNMASPVIS